ncbi:hypothetical protein NAEGRDRAFT_81290 [Naegleria gruberi]|uniref:Uncharacterized protein n=1 Tax=Naegleria gruberi TaxID=5762 RepID=D2VUQ4_NAEGR|nr:uncharacterized protein NAEGRDRAFT_81290 [Naegleria gruberi]EFC39548.1 hypothetical protein NAEGRDRAFT_81290 [Naegleria gruberi]|eukprot:XP_002672292.1 hypothetical protein NAEGRDRAFT_81290 [Naegleria gruberi strain NEG-M]
MEFSNIDKDFYENTKEIRYSETITPEEGMKKFQKYTSTCRDVYAFEKLVSKIFAEIEESCKKNNVPNEVNYQSFLKLPAIKFWMSKALESEPQSRATFASFLKLKLFEQDPLCSIMLFFDDMRLKKASEKESFFKELKSQVNKLSLSLFKKRILPRMTTLPFVTEPASGTFLAHLFSAKESSKRGIDGILSGKDYDEHILTFIRKCYISKNYSLRIRILQTLEYYQNQIPPSVAISEVIPEIMKAIKDSSNELVMFTMNACVAFSKYLSKLDQSTQSTTGIEIINNQFLPSLHHYAVQNSFPRIGQEVDKEKAIESVIALRSHALLCLLELWNLPGANKGIILTALHSNLFDKDISELKVHALNVILIHMSRFDPRELMTYVMKPVLPLTLHEKEQVRSKATQVMKVALEYLSESDLSRCNLGMITSANDGITNVTPFFPPQSQKELVRVEIFSGQSPKHVIQFSESDQQSKSSIDEGGRSTENTPPSSPAVVKKEFNPQPQEKTPEAQVESQQQSRLQLIKTASNKSIEAVAQQTQSHSSPAHSEDEEWKNWSDDEEKSVQVVETVKAIPQETTIVQNNPQPSPSSASSSQKKKKGLGFDSMEDDSYTPHDEEEDFFKDFSKEQESTPKTVQTSPKPTAGTTKTTASPSSRGGKRKPPKSKITQSQVKPEPTLPTAPQEEEPPKESNLSKILQEEENVENSNWDEIDMFSEMDIKN